MTSVARGVHLINSINTTDFKFKFSLVHKLFLFIKAKISGNDNCGNWFKSNQPKCHESRITSHSAPIRESTNKIFCTCLYCHFEIEAVVSLFVSFTAVKCLRIFAFVLQHTAQSNQLSKQLDVNFSIRCLCVSLPAFLCIQ